jgi:predicted nucleotidyltransferase
MFYLDLFRALQDEKVRYLVVGGVAVNLHGAERMTMDVDLMIAQDAENLPRFMEVARRLHLKPNLPVTLEQFCDAATLASWIRDKHMLALQLRPPAQEAPSIDILVKPVVPFEAAYARRLQMEVEDVKISVVAVEDLVALKTGTGRPIDQSDIQALHRLEMLRSRERDD